MLDNLIQIPDVDPYSNEAQKALRAAQAKIDAYVSRGQCVQMVPSSCSFTEHCEALANALQLGPDEHETGEQLIERVLKAAELAAKDIEAEFIPVAYKKGSWHMERRMTFAMYGVFKFHTSEAHTAHALRYGFNRSETDQ